MLQKRSMSPAAYREPEEWVDTSGTELAEIFERTVAAARRQWRVVVLTIALACALAVLYIITAVPLYTATINILIGQNTSKLVTELSDAGSLIEDDSQVLSQVELLKSEKIGNRVVDLLNLTQNPDFYPSHIAPLAQIKSFLSNALNVSSWFADASMAPTDQDTLRSYATDTLLAYVDVNRIGRTYVLTVSYTSHDPSLAASIARAFGEAYLADQLEAKYAATRSASDWLQFRIDDLRKRALASDLAVQKFTAEHGLVAADGRLMSDQNLSDLNTELIKAQGETAQARARYDRIQTIIKSGDTNAVVGDALNSSLINELRGKYLEAAKRQEEISQQLGPDHISAKRLRAEMEQYRRLIFDELGRIAESYQSDVKVAEAQEKQIREAVNAATGVTVTTNETLVQLRELERESQTYKSLYETFLQRYQESVQQENFPINSARIISEAKVPTLPSHPDSKAILFAAIILGAAAGVGIGAVREFRDRFFRTGDQIRDELGLEFLGIAPLVGSGPMPAEVAKSSDDGRHPRVIKKISSVSNFVIDHPLSQFAETLRGARFAADLSLGDRKPKIIGVVSILPGEGKSTIATNFAELLASLGSRTLLIDGDLRSPGLTRAVARQANVGLVEAIIDRKPLRDLLLVNPETKLAVLPAVVRHRITHTSELLSSAGMSAVLAEASQAFEHIVIDLPPIAPVVDARAVAAKVDAYILVVEWGKTARRAVRTLLASEPQIAEKCLGVILNKVDPEKMKLYWAFGSSEYYYSKYSNYHQAGT